MLDSQTIRNVEMICSKKLHKIRENVGPKYDKWFVRSSVVSSTWSGRIKKSFKFFSNECCGRSKDANSFLDRLAATWHACTTMRRPINQQDSSRPRTARALTPDPLAIPIPSHLPRKRAGDQNRSARKSDTLDTQIIPRLLVIYRTPG